MTMDNLPPDDRDNKRRTVFCEIKLVRSRLKLAQLMERMGDEKLTKRANAQKVEGKGGEEDRECTGRTALREIWK